jgi:hypothetical protein
MSISIQQLKQQRDRILALAGSFHAENVRVFGSVVRNEANDDSDVDFLVSFLPGASLFDQAGLMEELSLLLHRKVDVVSERAINPHLQQIIIGEALPL